MQPHQKYTSIMADLEMKSFWGYEKAYTLKDVQETRKLRFDNRHKVCSEVTPCNVTYSLEFLYSYTLPAFEHVYKDQDWEAHDAYMYFGKWLSGNMNTAWDDMLEKHFPDIDTRDYGNWVRAKDTFVM